MLQSALTQEGEGDQQGEWFPLKVETEALVFDESWEEAMIDFGRREEQDECWLSELIERK
jgi:hypothetical protein